MTIDTNQTNNTNQVDDINKAQIENAKLIERLEVEINEGFKKMQESCDNLEKIKKQTEEEFENAVLEELKTDEEKAADKKFRVASFK